ncbi:MAG TPA: type 1 glutamine amidotransferase [Candidatus Marinimicrobia bacterium]|nr:type 1 glutamine amidotransferase [Candidatus Neomarinimicrobiota bacterium]
MISKPAILIIRMGNTYRELSAECGNFERWIVAALPQQPVKWKSLKIEHVIPQEIAKYQGIILTGAHDTLTEPYPYLKGVERLLDEIVDHKIMTLGICFGHQILQLLLGGEVIRNPLGPEIGVSRINLTLAGLANPLFQGLNHAKIEVYSSHYDIVSSVTDGVVSLAWNEQTEFQACSYEGFIYTTQFHPEYTKPVMEYYIRKNYEILKREHFHNPLNIPRPDIILKRNKQIKSSAKVLQNFINLILQQGGFRQG